MPLQLGDFKLPTPGDFVAGTEAMIGNVIEGVIEATTGAAVELTPGVGVDNTRIKGARGSGDVQFDKKLASHEEVETLRKEVKKLLLGQAKEIAKLKVALRTQDMRYPVDGGRPPTWNHYGPGAAQGSQMNPLMMLLLLRQGESDLTNNPFAMLVLMQALQGASIGTVGNQPIQIDLTTIALLTSAFGFLRPAQRTIAAPAAATPTPP